MQRYAKAFFVSGLVYGVLGIGLGLHMAISHDHGQMPTHAHIMVIGWLSFAVFGIFYALYGTVAPRGLMRLHFWLAQISAAGIVVGLFLVYSGRSQYEPIAAVSAIGYAISFLIFVAVALSAISRAPERVGG